MNNQNRGNLMKYLLTGLLIALGSIAHSANIDYNVDSNGNPRIIYQGNVEVGDAQTLNWMLLSKPVNYVIMHSPGGSATEGQRIGQVLSNHEATVWVPPGSFCLSACAEAFIGAKEYRIEGALGFHTAWFKADPGIDYNELFKHGQAQGASTTRYILANGFNINLALLINYHTDAKNFLVFFSEEDLAKFFARSETDTITEYLEGPDFELTDDWLDLHIMDGPRLFRYLGYT